MKKIYSHILPAMLTLMMLGVVTIAQAVNNSAQGFDLVQSPIGLVASSK